MTARVIILSCCVLALYLGPASQDDVMGSQSQSDVMKSLGTVVGEAAQRIHERAAVPAPVQTCKTDLADELQRLDVPGLAAAIIKDGRIVCTATAGMANIEQNRPVTPDTLFLIASVSKTITATALMQLYDQGKFKLDDDINNYLPFRVRIPLSPETPITFRQLLMHASSIKDNLAYVNCPDSCLYGSSPIPFVTRGADSPISLADLMKGYLMPGGAYYDENENFEPEPPGTKVDYSNMGIVLAGYLVEVISGVPFDQYCKDHIFTPLGMNSTSWRLAGIDESKLAMPYDKSWSGYVPFGHYGEPDYPDGMLRTSVNELSQFLIAYMQGGEHNGRKILRSSTVEDMLDRQTSLDRSVGLAWFNRSVGGRRVWGHDGDDHGAGTKMWLDPDDKIGVILMTNGIWKEDKTKSLLNDLFEEADDY
jgi:CubicO group peptidase (beta-lactamase class C family)